MRAVFLFSLFLQMLLQPSVHFPHRHRPQDQLLPMRMKVIRVPWISCRADEVDAIHCELEWAGRIFKVMAYSEKEAREWWRNVPITERNELLSIGEPPIEDEPGLF